MKKLLCVIAVLACICCVIAYTHFSTHTGLRVALVEQAKAYISTHRCVEPSEEKELSAEDYAALRAALGKIKAYDPRVDLDSGEYIIYGSSFYILRIDADGAENEIWMEGQETTDGTRKFLMSDPECHVAAYIPDETVRTMHEIFTAYGLEIGDQLYPSTE